MSMRKQSQSKAPEKAACLMIPCSDQQHCCDFWLIILCFFFPLPMQVQLGLGLTNQTNSQQGVLTRHFSLRTHEIMVPRGLRCSVNLSSSSLLSCLTCYSANHQALSPAYYYVFSPTENESARNWLQTGICKVSRRSSDLRYQAE